MPKYIDAISREAALEIVKRTSGDYASAWTEIEKFPTADVAPELSCDGCYYHNRVSGMVPCGNCRRNHQMPDHYLDGKEQK